MSTDVRDLLQGYFNALNDRDIRACLALVSDDLEAFRQAAHSFKGSCGNMGALALEQACLNAEKAALQGDAEAASSSYSRIRERFTRLQAILSC